jgi:hypothetical protein
MAYVVALRDTPTRVGRRDNARSRNQHRARHPHARGAEALAYSEAVCVAETPPRAWGGAADHRSMPLRSRDTPTRVGRRSAGVAALWSQARHPHARGAEPTAALLGLVRNETPPRAWGGAGNQLSGVSGMPRHPHARGAEMSTRCRFDPDAETPPRAWDGAVPGVSRTRVERVTPTRGWGGAVQTLAGAPGGRVTPTRVGRNRRARIEGVAAPSHPHGRGAGRSA